MRTLALAGTLLAFALKAAVAARLDLFGDEAFYWVSSQRPVFWIVPGPGLLPPVTPMMVAAGVSLFGHTTLGVRFAFLLVGLALPFVIYRIARAHVDREGAWLAAAVSLVIPITFSPGLAAVPDAPLLFFSALSLLAFQSATANGRWRDWILLGLWGALGLSTHYRFSITVLSALLYLVLTPRGRAQWRSPGLWLAGGMAALGLVPLVVFAVMTDMAPLRYYLQGRHSGAVDPAAALEFVGTQVGLVTPLIFVVFMATLVRLVRRARAGEDRAALMACFAATPLMLFFVVSPLESTGLVVMHWPLPGYLPLVVLLPETLRQFVAARPTRLRKVAAVSTPLFGAVAAGVLLIELGTEWFKVSNLRWNYWGWSDVAAEVAELDQGGPALVVADNYVLAAELMFARGNTEDAYILDHPDNHYHGRAAQIAHWELGEDGLRARAGEPALFVVQMDETPGKEREAWLEHVASFTNGLEPAGELRVDSTWRKKRDGRWKFKLFKFFRGTVRAGDSMGNPRAQASPR
jgi:4-amino-4-deoxy-L-arabinose transferase-like glycosyltransferase